MQPKHELEEILFGGFISVTGGIIAGFGLTLFLDKILEHPGLFILLPGLLAMRGDISGTMGARLSAALQLHRLSAKVKHSKVIRDNTIASFVLALVGSLCLGLVAFFATWLFFGVVSPSIIFIAVIATIISSVFMLPLTTGAVFWLFRHGFDPDDILGPYITTIGDIIMVSSLFLAVVVI